MKTRGRGARRPTQWVAGSLLMLSSTAAMALGLGQIQVKSRPGQPLLAEIPIISNVAGELDGATARLAPPDVFARVGLEPPQGLVGGLQFDIVPNAQGRMVVRVTSSEPVSAQALSFLVEVDWGKGRLVREYSALVDELQTAAALAEPQIQAPTAAPSDMIERQPEVAQEHLPPAVADSRPEARPVAAPAAPVPAAHPRRPTAAKPADVASASEWTVRQGQTLSQIARRLGQGDATLDQTMLALLHANPEAFIGGNINRLRAGAVLRVPAQDERTRRTASEASALVREQVAQWRQAGKPVMQPAEPSAPVSRADASAAPVHHRAAATAKAPASARLEIAPAAARDGQKAGNQSGIAAGGKGDTLMNEQLRQAKEDLASRDAEIQELRSRVAELEKLQQDQQKLISLKDNELASAQKHLADPAQVTAATPAAHPAAAAPAKTATPAPVAPTEVSGTPFWMWGGAGLVLLGLIGVWVRQRRARKTGEDTQRPRFDIDALAPAAASAAPVADAEPADGFGPAADEQMRFQDDGRPETGADEAPLHDDLHDVDSAADALPLHAVADDAAEEGLAGAPPEAHAEDEPRYAWLANDAAPVEPAVDAASDDGLHEEPSVADAVPAIDMADPAPAELAEDAFEREAPSFAATHEPVPVDETQAHADAVDEAQDVMQPAVQAEPLIEPVFTDEPAPSAVSDAQAPAEVEPAPSMPEPGESTASKPAPSVADTVAGGGDGLADRERLDLAIAYLDMGDTETAREMLEEAKASRDPQVRGEAEQLLREIG